MRLHFGFWQFRLSSRGIYREANQQIVKYSESLVSQGAELSKAQGEAKESGDVAEEITQQLDAEQKKSTSYQALLNAYAAYTQNEYDAAALEIQKVYEDQLGDDVREFIIPSVQLLVCLESRKTVSLRAAKIPLIPKAMMELTIQQKALKRIPLVMTVLTMMHLVTVGMMNPDILITATKTDIMMKMVIFSIMIKISELQ